RAFTGSRGAGVRVWEDPTARGSGAGETSRKRMREQALTAEESRRLQVFQRLNAIATVLMICVVMFFAYFLPTPLFHQVATYGLALLTAVVSLVCHLTLAHRVLCRMLLFG